MITRSDLGEKPVVMVHTVYAFQKLSQCFLCRLARDRPGGGGGSEGLRQMCGRPLLGTFAPICSREASGFECFDQHARLILPQVEYVLNSFQIPVEAISECAHQLANEQYWITTNGIFGVDPHFLVSIVQFVPRRATGTVGR